MRTTLIALGAVVTVICLLGATTGDGGATPEPGKPWTIPVDTVKDRAESDRVLSGMEFVWVPAMKCWVGKYEVTNAEYRMLKPTHSSGEFWGQSLDGDRQPVVLLTYYDALAFAQWVTDQERLAGRLPKAMRYRLPTPDEFKVFQQCGDGHTYPWGNDLPPPNDWNYFGKEGQREDWPKVADHDDGWPVSCPVEKSGRNGWGLYGVGDNVSEWTSRPTAPNNGAITCGASWKDGRTTALKCGQWGCHWRAGTHDGIGFRLLLAPEEPGIGLQ